MSKQWFSYPNTCGLVGVKKIKKIVCIWVARPNDKELLVVHPKRQVVFQSIVNLL